MRFTRLTCGLVVAVLGACGGADFSAKPGGGTGGATASTGGATSSTGGSTGNGGTGGTGGAGTGGTGGAGTGGATTAQLWCDTRTGALLCEDFDSSTSVDTFLQSWSSSTQINGTLDFTGGASAPNALRVQSTATTDIRTLVLKTLPPFAIHPASLKLGFDLKIDKADSIGSLSGVVIGAIVTGTDPYKDGVFALEIAPRGTGFGLYAVYYRAGGDAGLSLGSQFVSALPTAGTWARVTIEVLYTKAADAAQTACLQASVGVGAPSSCVALPDAMSAPPSVATVALGAVGIAVLGTPTNGNIDLSFDNVLLTRG